MGYPSLPLLPDADVDDADALPDPEPDPLDADRELLEELLC